jgi:hypothetical protein
MAEKGVVGDVEESISRRLRRKRDTFYGENESDESTSSTSKRRRDELPLETASFQKDWENAVSGDSLMS